MESPYTATLPACRAPNSVSMDKLLANKLPINKLAISKLLVNMLSMNKLSMHKPSVFLSVNDLSATKMSLNKLFMSKLLTIKQSMNQLSVHCTTMSEEPTMTGQTLKLAEPSHRQHLQTTQKSFSGNDVYIPATGNSA